MPYLFRRFLDFVHRGPFAGRSTRGKPRSLAGNSREAAKGTAKRRRGKETLTTDASPNSNAILLFRRSGLLFLRRRCLLFFPPRRSVSLASLCRLPRSALDDALATMRPFTYKCLLAMDIPASSSRHGYRRTVSPLPFPPSLSSSLFPTHASFRLQKPPVIKRVSRLDVSIGAERERRGFYFRYRGRTLSTAVGTDRQKCRVHQVRWGLIVGNNTKQRGEHSAE